MIQHNCLDKKTVIKSDYLGEDIYNLLDTTFTLPAGGFNFNIFDVSEEYIARPDLISLDAYGDTMFADVICKLNGISNPFELNDGMKIILPNPEYITSFIGTPQYIEKNDKDNKNPNPKKFNETRGVNDAIAGDTRFKVDSTNRIIIY